MIGHSYSNWRLYITTARTDNGQAMLIRRIGYTNHHNLAYGLATDEEGYLAFAARAQASYWANHVGYVEFLIGRHDEDFYDASCGIASDYNT